MRVTRVLFVLLAASACGNNPTAPSVSEPSVRLAVLILGNTSKTPKVGVSVRLAPLGYIPLPGNQPRVRTTGTDGVASWDVYPRHRYPMIINGLPAFWTDVIVTDSQWLVGVPD